MSKFIPQGLGWVPDLPDPRDYTYRHDAVLPVLQRLRQADYQELPSEVDLRCDGEGEYFTTPEQQGSLNASAAFAVLSLLEYFERRIRGRTFEGSKLFLYKATRNRLHKWRTVKGDTGADLRTTLKVLFQLGVPPEEHWPYDVANFDEEPSSFVYSMARPPVGVHYFRIDPRNVSGSAIWETLTSFLAAGFPVAFGFSVPSALTSDANIPYRADFDAVRGGEAVVAVGYRNDHFGPGQHALLIRGSWGRQWGACGNGWLPMTYVHHQLARDYWTLLSADWCDSLELSRPTVIDQAE